MMHKSFLRRCGKAATSILQGILLCSRQRARTRRCVLHRLTTETATVVQVVLRSLLQRFLGVDTKLVVEVGHRRRGIADLFDLRRLRCLGRLCDSLSSRVIVVGRLILDRVCLRIKRLDLRRGSVQHQHACTRRCLGFLHTRCRQSLDDLCLVSCVAMRTGVQKLLGSLHFESQVFAIRTHTLLLS